MSVSNVVLNDKYRPNPALLAAHNRAEVGKIDIASFYIRIQGFSRSAGKVYGKSLPHQTYFSRFSQDITAIHGKIYRSDVAYREGTGPAFLFYARTHEFVRHNACGYEAGKTFVKFKRSTSARRSHRRGYTHEGHAWKFRSAARRRQRPSARTRRHWGRAVRQTVRPHLLHKRRRYP